MTFTRGMFLSPKRRADFADGAVEAVLDLFRDLAQYLGLLLQFGDSRKQAVALGVQLGEAGPGALGLRAGALRFRMGSGGLGMRALRVRLGGSGIGTGAVHLGAATRQRNDPRLERVQSRSEAFCRQLELAHRAPFVASSARTLGAQRKPGQRKGCRRSTERVAQTLDGCGFGPVRPRSAALEVTT